MKIGFTGTRKGMTRRQRDAFIEVVSRLYEQPGDVEFHHGDCIGADREFHDFVILLPGRMVIHPPVDETHRAFCSGFDEMREARTHFARNRDIVNESDTLIGAPMDMEHQVHGGTWYTIDFAQKRGKPVWIIWPDGSVTQPETMAVKEVPDTHT